MNRQDGQYIILSRFAAKQFGTMRISLRLTFLHFTMLCASARVAIQKVRCVPGVGKMLSRLCPAAPGYIHAGRYFSTFPKTSSLD
jgi:hypothetical protein